VSEAALRVEGVSKRFGGVRAVDGVDLEVASGAALGVIGPNGSGKTTLLNLITGFVRPDGGRVFLRGRDVTGLPPHRLVSLGLARSFQLVRPFYQLPAYKNLIIPLCSPRVRALRGGGYGDRNEVAIHLLEEVGFERDSAVPYKPAKDLPHGYLKRLELARCLAVEPDVLMLDELFSGMSVSEVTAILPLIDRLRQEGKTLVMVEHRLRELFRVVDRVIVLDFGRVIAQGTPREVMEDTAVRKAYLGTEVRRD
jgi:branched-chain amino acid transport system ATP-binding protein